MILKRLINIALKITLILSLTACATGVVLEQTEADWMGQKNESGLPSCNNSYRAKYQPNKVCFGIMSVFYDDPPWSITDDPRSDFGIYVGIFAKFGFLENADAYFIGEWDSGTVDEFERIRLAKLKNGWAKYSERRNGSNDHAIGYEGTIRDGFIDNGEVSSTCNEVLRYNPPITYKVERPHRWFTHLSMRGLSEDYGMFLQGRELDFLCFNGQVKNGEPYSGTGIVKHENRVHYGEFINGELQEGEIVGLNYPRGTYYRGSFDNYQRDGQGEGLVRIDQDKLLFFYFKGQWENDKPRTGILYYKDSFDDNWTRFEGSFKDGMPYEGTYHGEGSIKFVGLMKDYFPHKGTFANGFYGGCVFTGTMEGPEYTYIKGRSECLDGSSKDGEWQRNKRNNFLITGEEVSIDSNGNPLLGVWEKGKRVSGKWADWNPVQECKNKFESAIERINQVRLATLSQFSREFLQTPTGSKSYLDYEEMWKRQREEESSQQKICIQNAETLLRKLGNTEIEN